MKRKHLTLLCTLLFFSAFLFSKTTIAQKITSNTTLAKEYFDKAIEFFENSNYSEALKYTQKAQELYIKHLGENSLQNANCCYFSGLCFYFLSDLDNVLLSFLRYTHIQEQRNDAMNTKVADIYNLTGLVYSEKSEYDKALEYYQKALEIRKELLSEKNIDVADSYNNIGIVYQYKSEYDKALEYFQRALEIKKELLGEEHIDVASSYNNIGVVYSDKSEYDKALEYHQKALEIRKELLGEKHSDVAMSYNNIGSVYSEKSEYDKALEYYQKALVSNLINYIDSINLLSVPKTQDYLDWKRLLISLYQKSNTLSLETNNVEKLQSALNHYLACDTLISLARK